MMKATGIVRNLDTLHRIVIPIELCRTLGLNPGDPIEIFTGDDGHIILRKFSIDGPAMDAVNLTLDHLKGVDTECANEIREHLTAVKELLPGALA